MTPPSLLKLLKPLNILNIEALRIEKFANPEEKKMQYACSTVAKLCCCMGSFLEGLFGMTGMHDGLLTVTLVCFKRVPAHAPTHTHPHTH